MGNDLAVNGLWLKHRVRYEGNGDELNLDASTAELLTHFQSGIDGTFQVSLQTLAEVLKESGTSGEYNVLVQSTTHVNGASLT